MPSLHGASVLLLQKWKVVEAVVETLWPSKLKILRILLFLENIWRPLVQMNGAPWSAAPACAPGSWGLGGLSSCWMLLLADLSFAFQRKSYSSWQTWVMCPVFYHPWVWGQAIAGAESWSLALQLPSFEHTSLCQYSPLTVGSQKCVRSSRNRVIQSSEEKWGLALRFCVLGLCVTACCSYDSETKPSSVFCMHSY